MKRKSQRKHSLFVVIILMCICLFIYFVFPLPPCALSSFDKRAIWVSYKDLEKLSFESKEDFCKDYLEILENVQKYEVNTMIVHVRAFADALYYSKLFPISQVVSKRQIYLLILWK